MSSIAPTSTATASTAPNRFVHFLVRRRVPISIAVFGLLMIEDFFRERSPTTSLIGPIIARWLGLLSVLGGLTMRSWAAGFLTKSTELTMIGPYRLVRNPLYLGSFLMVVGICLLIGDRRNSGFPPWPWLIFCISPRSARKSIFWPAAFPASGRNTRPPRRASCPG